MPIESSERAQRVRFKHPIRIVTLDGPPRVIRTLTTNVSRRGLFVRMPQPLPEGCRVALSLEAAGRALAFAQAEVAWGRAEESRLPGRYAGCGVRFTEFLHPRAEALVEYLVSNLDTGKPLTLPRASRRSAWLIGGAVAGALGLTAIGVGSFLLLSPGPASADAELVPLAVLAPAQVELAPAPEPATTAPVGASDLGMTGEAVAGSARSGSVAEAPGPAPVAAAPSVEGEEAPSAAPMRVAAVDAVQEEPQAPVEAPAEVVAAETPTKPAAAPLVETSKGTVRLPSGAAAKLAWSSDGRIVRLTPTLAPGAKLSKAFLLAGPSRAVLDFEGVAPKKSHQLDATAPHVSGVRVGKLGRGTRVVVDLEDVPASLTVADGIVTLSF